MSLKLRIPFFGNVLIPKYHICVSWAAHSTINKTANLVRTPTLVNFLLDRLSVRVLGKGFIFGLPVAFNR